MYLQGMQSLNAGNQTARQVTDEMKPRYAVKPQFSLNLSSCSPCPFCVGVFLGGFQVVKCLYSPGVFAALAILGVAIFIMLIVILYCFMKGRGKSAQHQRVPVNTVPVTYEDRERLVYNSTTKPL